MASIGDTTRPAFAYDQATDTWVPVGVGPHSHTPAAIGAISNSLTTTTGDLIYAASANTPARLGIGSTGQVLSVSGGVPAWATVSSGPTGWSLLNTGGTALTGAATITVSSVSAKQLMILVENASSVNSFADYRITFNGDTGTNYLNFGIYNNIGPSWSAGNFDNIQSISDNRIQFAQLGDNAASKASGYVFVDLCDKTGWKSWHSASSGDGTSGAVNFQQFTTGGIYKGSAAITSVSIYSTGGNFDNGTIYIYGAN